MLESNEIQLYRNVYISVDGVDGAGKTTCIELLKKSFEGMGFEVETISEFNGTALGKELKKLFLGDAELPGESKLNGLVEMLLVFAARAQSFLENKDKFFITPATGGKIFLLDRFYASTAVYQVMGKDVPSHLMNLLRSYTTGMWDVDYSIFIDCDAVSAAKRIQIRKHLAAGGSLQDDIPPMSQEEQNLLFANTLQFKTYFKSQGTKTLTINNSENQVLTHEVATQYAQSIIDLFSFFGLAGEPMQAAPTTEAVEALTETVQS